MHSRVLLPLGQVVEPRLALLTLPAFDAGRSDVRPAPACMGVDSNLPPLQNDEHGNRPRPLATGSCEAPQQLRSQVRARC